MTHLDYDRQSPVWRHWVRELSRGHTLIRYDERGCGLSDRLSRAGPGLRSTLIAGGRGAVVGDAIAGARDCESIRVTAFRRGPIGHLGGWSMGRGTHDLRSPPARGAGRGRARGGCGAAAEAARGLPISSCTTVSLWANDGRKTAASAVAIDGRRVVAVGSNRKVMRRAGARTRVIDLEARSSRPASAINTHLLEDASTGADAASYRPTFTPFDPEAPNPGRLDTARRHEDTFNRGATPVDECTRSPVTAELGRTSPRCSARRFGRVSRPPSRPVSRISASLTRCASSTALAELRMRHLVRVAGGCVEEAARMGLRTA